MKVAIIGGGAAGFFIAANLKLLAPDTSVTIFEKQTDVMKKVLISGGGRCNVTNSFEGVTDLKQVYPRGHKLLKNLFNIFDYRSAYQWFERNGVKLTTQDDHCVFPLSQDAHSIANCLKNIATRTGVIIKTSHCVNNILKTENGYDISFKEEHLPVQTFDCVAITTGGSPQSRGLDYLKDLGHLIEEPVPSLFTFNINDATLHDLMGTVVEPVTASIAGTKFKAEGALLVTHWGMSGPAILKLSSHAARYVNEQNYRFPLLVNWVNESNNEKVAETLRTIADNSPNKQIGNVRPYNLPTRLWEYLIGKCGLTLERKWNELGKKGINRLTNTLCNDSYEVDGRGVFRDQFVTCGGISLSSVHRNTLESKTCPGLFFAGEVLDIDGVTGGFNFQAAWTTGYTVAKAISERT